MILLKLSKGFDKKLHWEFWNILFYSSCFLINTCPFNILKDTALRGSWLKSSKSKGSYYSFFLPSAFLACLVLLIGTAFVGRDYTQKPLKWGLQVIRCPKCPTVTCEEPQHVHLERQPAHQEVQPMHQETQPGHQEVQPPHQETQPVHQEGQTVQREVQPLQQEPQLVHEKCLPQIECRPRGSEPLPKGLVANTSDLQMQPLWGRRTKVNPSRSLFTVAVGIKQKEMVDKMVRKFLSSDFSVMLFHYDGVVDAWKDLDWANNVVHVSATNQTKWWFAKRFLHPDIVSDYSYIFLWDEDIGVENFDPDRYMSIVRNEGLEISQPALDTKKSEVHHTITARLSNSIVHRRVHKAGNSRSGCDETSQNPPCTGWIELMAPVFSRAAWRCVWYMIQNDLLHAWGLDILLGYCAPGDRTRTVGIVDAEYIVHHGLPTLGEPENKPIPPTDGNKSQDTNTAGSEPPGKSTAETNVRLEVRRQSFREYKIFRRRWEMAAKEDESWADPYPGSLSYNIL